MRSDKDWNNSSVLWRAAKETIRAPKKFWRQNLGLNLCKTNLIRMQLKCWFSEWFHQKPFLLAQRIEISRFLFELFSFSCTKYNSFNWICRYISGVFRTFFSCKLECVSPVAVSSTRVLPLASSLSLINIANIDKEKKKSQQTVQKNMIRFNIKHSMVQRCLLAEPFFFAFFRETGSW